MARAYSTGIHLELSVDEASALLDLLASGVSSWTLEQMELNEVLLELRKVAPRNPTTFREIAILDGPYHEG